MLKTQGRSARVSWDTALTTMVEKFREVQARHGAGAVGIISTGQLVTEEFYALGKLVQLGLGTSNFDGNTTLCMSTAVAGYKRSFGSDGPPGSYEDMELADFVMLIGANIAENHPILCHRLDVNPAATLVVVDPAGHQDGHVRGHPPADPAAVRPRAAQRPHPHHHRAGRRGPRVHRQPHHGLRGAPRVGVRLYAGAGVRDHRHRRSPPLRGGRTLCTARAAFIGWTMG